MYTCDKCSKKFRNRKNLNKHLKENHKAEASLTSHDMAIIKKKSDISLKLIPDNVENVNTIEIGKPKICEDLSNMKKLSKNLKTEKSERYSNEMTAKEDSSYRNVEMIETNKEKDKDHKSGIKTRLRNYQCTEKKKSEGKSKSTKSFVCKFCSRSFITKYRLRKHLQQSHKKESVKLQNQKDTSIMVEHSTKISGKRIHQCQFCKKQFSEKFTLAYHVDKLHQRDKSITFHRERLNNAKLSSQYNVNSKHLLTTKAEQKCSREESSEDLDVCNSALNFRKRSSEYMIVNNSEVNSNKDSSENLNENSVVNSYKNNSEDLLLDNAEVYSCIDNSKDFLLNDNDSSSSDEEKDYVTANFVVNKKVLANMTELEKDLIRQYGGSSTEKKTKKRKRKIRKRINTVVAVERRKAIEHPDVIINDASSPLQKLKATPECDDDKSSIKAILLMKMLPQTKGDKILGAPILRVEKLIDYKIRIAIEAGNNIVLNELSRIEIYATTANIDGEWVLIAELSTHKPPLIIHVIQTIKTRYFFSVRGIGYNGYYTIFSIPATW
ncbi:zinc finger protein 724-like isoform X2 [Teleopsis dalmanni]|uniref:zinc finger protein 724-like isoform X2 n=1 Tax=Teleopsis dalmanni TaxID=139649 RepID=UPI0018CC9976|nr:zinc finger protein 724-like isoform X2 [Teleopsis dalmanni]